MSEVTTIPVRKDTRDMLKSFGKKGDTYDSIIRELMEKAEYADFMERQYRILEKKEDFIPLDEI